MTNCIDIQPKLPALLDGEVSDEEAAVMRQHVERCHACAAILADFGRIHAAASAAPAVATPDLWNAVQERIAEPTIDSLIVEELRLMRKELQRLRAEVAGLRHEVARRPGPGVPRSNALSFPDAPQRSQQEYKLV